MEKKKIFGLDSNFGEASYFTLMEVIEKSRKPFEEPKIYAKEWAGPLPRGYDVYIIHFPDTSFKEIKSLRKEQPKSYFLSFSRGEVPSRIASLFDGRLTILNCDRIEKILLEVLEKEKTT